MGISTRTVAGLVMLTAGSLLTGCVANSSNPTVAVRRASMTDDAASIALTLGNPGGRRLTINRVDYELSHGEMALPVASGYWTGDVDLPAGGEAELTLDIKFDEPPLEPDSTLLHLSGVLGHKDHTGFLWLKSMDLGETAFKLDVQAEGESR
ncbi:MAG: LEA type 2 family protein [Phycisphaerales bacterium]